MSRSLLIPEYEPFVETAQLLAFGAFPGAQVELSYTICTAEGCPCGGGGVKIAVLGESEPRLRVSFAVGREDGGSFITVPDLQHDEGDPALDLMQAWKNDFFEGPKFAWFETVVAQRQLEASEGRKRRALERAEPSVMERRVAALLGPGGGKSAKLRLLGKEGEQALLSLLRKAFLAVLDEHSVQLEPLLFSIGKLKFKQAIPVLFEGLSCIDPDELSYESIHALLIDFDDDVFEPALAIVDDESQSEEVRFDALMVLALGFDDDERVQQRISHFVPRFPTYASALVSKKSDPALVDRLHQLFATHAAVFPGPLEVFTMHSIAQALLRCDALNEDERKLLATLPIPEALLDEMDEDEDEHEPSAPPALRLVAPAEAASTTEPKRNELCTCGSGRKFKKCCGKQ